MPQTELAPVEAFIGLGANLGDAVAAVRAAIAAIADLPGTHLVATSSLYRSVPVDAGGPDYVNAVVQVRTVLPALALLAQLQNMENQAGRERPYTNAPRTLDLDLLLYGQQKVDTAVLTVPHPRMLQRAFVLLPLAEIAPGRVLQAQLQAVADQRLMRIDG